MRHFRLIRIVTAATGLALVGSGCAGPADRSPQHAPRDIRLAPDGPSIDAKVPPNATFETLLKRNEVPADVTSSVLKAMGGVFNPRELRANQDYRITRTLDGLFREFRYQIDADRLLRVFARPAASDPGVLSAEVITIPKEYKLDALAGEIGRGQSLIGVWKRPAKTCSSRSRWRRFSAVRSISTRTSSPAIALRFSLSARCAMASSSGTVS
jgi:hypothetical protein